MRPASAATIGELMRKAKVTPSGMPDSTKPMNNGSAEHELDVLGPSRGRRGGVRRQSPQAPSGRSWRCGISRPRARTTLTGADASPDQGPVVALRAGVELLDVSTAHRPTAGGKAPRSPATVGVAATYSSLGRQRCCSGNLAPDLRRAGPDRKPDQARSGRTALPAGHRRSRSGRASAR